MNAALYGHSLPLTGLALSCRPLLLGEMHLLLAHRCLCSAGSALFPGIAYSPCSSRFKLPSFLVPLEVWPFLVHLHQIQFKAQFKRDLMCMFFSGVGFGKEEILFWCGSSVLTGSHFHD